MLVKTHQLIRKQRVYSKELKISLKKKDDKPKKKSAPTTAADFRRRRRGESVNESKAEKEKIFNMLVKRGDTPVDARYEVDKSYDFIKKEIS